MIPIKLILIALSLAVTGAYFARFRTGLSDKLVVLAIALTGLVFIVHPESTMWLANKLGVGRGADLVFYLALLFFLYTTILLYSKLQKIQEDLTQVVRELAIARSSDHSS